MSLLPRVAILGLLAAHAVCAQDTTQSRVLKTVKVIGRIDDLVGVASSASEGRIGAADLRARPISREGELLETVPGMIVTQHSGEGKANQYFVRGFNLDHGTDFQTRVDGMPINMPTHGHGQGYTDLNFLIPELVDHIDYRLGVHHAEIGDFGSAGGAELHLLRDLSRPFATVGTGPNGLARIAAGQSTTLGGGNWLVAGEAKSYDGPWAVKEGMRKLTALTSYSWTSGTSQFSVLGMAYRNRWRANDQIPDRAVTAGALSRFGQIDSTDGGATRRYSVSASWRRVGGSALQEIQLFGIYSDLSLFSDFTFFLDDPTRGDQFNQTDRRTIIGGRVTDTRQLDAFGVSHVLKTGLETRADIITELGLYHTQRRERFDTERDDRVNQVGSGLFLEAESHWTPRFRSVLGARGDAYLFDVTDKLGGSSVRRTAAIASPKASLIFAPSNSAELYLSGGFGFHSNDARVGNHPLVRSRGGELGLRATPRDELRSTVSLWTLDLDSELLYAGDAGTTEASAESRRWGVTFANFYRPSPALSVDADLSFANARFAGGETRIPGALERVGAAGLTWTPVSGAFASLRVRHFGSYSLTEDNGVRARPSTLGSVETGYRLTGGTRMQVSVLNAFNGSAEDIQYFYVSRLRGEPAGGVGGIHSHAAEPRQVRVSVERPF